VLDFLMPGLNGLEAAREITSTVPNARVLMCTMYLSRQLSRVARNAGLRGAISKGRATQLARGVAALLRGETFFEA
jgi:DNA-binding NarL/FixJ family response regulator